MCMITKEIEDQIWTIGCFQKLWSMKWIKDLDIYGNNIINENEKGNERTCKIRFDYKKKSIVVTAQYNGKDTKTVERQNKE